MILNKHKSLHIIEWILYSYNRTIVKQKKSIKLYSEVTRIVGYDSKTITQKLYFIAIIQP